MKQLFIVVSIFLLAIEASAQNVGIGTTTPATILDVTSTTQGVLLPRVTTAQMNAIVSPANGLLVTNTDSLNRIFIYTGTGWSGLSTFTVTFFSFIINSNYTVLEQYLYQTSVSFMFIAKLSNE